MLFIKNLARAKINERFLRSVAEISLMNLPKLSKKSREFEIDLVITGEKKMKELNRSWRGKDKATDVLSFESASLLRHSASKTSRRTKERPLASGSEFIFPPDGIFHLGQIFICFSVADRQAKEYGFTVKKELARLLVHGILHLAGYDHEKNAKEEKKMSKLEKEIIEKILIR